jgi:type VI secretion system secreted protein Hcp
MAIDIFLKLDGLPGESRDRVHADEIDVQSYSWGLANTLSIGTAGGGAGAGKASFQDLNYTSATHKSSPKLMAACALGRRIDTAVLTVRRSGGGNPVDFLKITLTDVFVASYNQAAAEGGDSVVEDVSLAFVKIQFSYAEQRPDGTLATPVVEGWDRAANRST